MSTRVAVQKERPSIPLVIYTTIFLMANAYSLSLFLEPAKTPNFFAFQPSLILPVVNLSSFGKRKFKTKLL